MPLYETRNAQGRISVRLKALTCVEQDIQNFGAIERSDQELVGRAQYHIGRMEANLPTVQAILADDREAFSRLIVDDYSAIYKGLLVGYTGFKEPFRLSIEPRFTTSVSFDGSEDEHEFVGSVGLLSAIKAEQDAMRKYAQDDECNANECLRTLAQVTISDTQDGRLDWLEKPQRFICYTLHGDEIGEVYEQYDVSDDVLRGLSLPIAETIVSLSSKRGEA